MGFITVITGIIIFGVSVLAGYFSAMFGHWVFKKISKTIRTVRIIKRIRESTR